MEKSLYSETKKNAPLIKIKKNAREVILELVSCMCDNKYRFLFKKNSDGDFKLSTFGQAFSNFHIDTHKKIDLEWLADEGKWDSIIKIINSGTQKVYDSKSR